MTEKQIKIIAKHTGKEKTTRTSGEYKEYYKFTPVENGDDIGEIMISSDNLGLAELVLKGTEQGKYELN
jgi:hypothetical protein